MHLIYLICEIKLMITPEIMEPMAAAMATTAAHPLSITIFPQLIRSSLEEATNIKKMGAGFECSLNKRMRAPLARSKQ